MDQRTTSDEGRQIEELIRRADIDSPAKTQTSGLRGAASSATLRSPSRLARSRVLAKESGLSKSSSMNFSSMQREEVSLSDCYYLPLWLMKRVHGRTSRRPLSGKLGKLKMTRNHHPLGVTARNPWNLMDCLSQQPHPSPPFLSRRTHLAYPDRLSELPPRVTHWPGQPPSVASVLKGAAVCQNRSRCSASRKRRGVRSIFPLRKRTNPEARMISARRAEGNESTVRVTGRLGL